MNQALKIEQERYQECLTLIRLETEITEGGSEYITRVLVSNNGTISSKIRAVYIDSELVMDPTSDITLNHLADLNAKESLWIQFPSLTVPYQEPSYMSMTTERGTSAMEQEGKLKNPEDPPPVIVPPPAYGPLQLDFEDFYYSEYYPEINFESTTWKPGWSIELGARPIAWRVTVTNVGSKPITLSKYSALTTMPNTQAVKQKPWYLEPTKSESGDTSGVTIDVDERVQLVYIWESADAINPRSIYGIACQLKVILTFYGVFHELGEATKPYGQTIPFEAVMITLPRLEISANPTTIATGSSMYSTISVIARNSFGDPAPFQDVLLSTTLGTFQSSTETVVKTDSLGVATAILNPGLIPGTATVTATWDALSRSTIVNIATGTLELVASREIVENNPSMTSTLTATVRLNGVLLVGQAVQFLLTGPGSLSVSSGITNSVGQVAVTYTPTSTTGTATVTASWADQTAAKDIHVAGTVTVSPSSSTAIAGQSMVFAATASDAFGNSWTVTDQVVWTIDSGAGGTWVQATGTYTADNAGFWTVRATFGTISGTASLTVDPASAVGVSVVPAASTVVAGQSQGFVATARDSFDNTWVVTDEVIWSIDLGAGGSWVQATGTYTSAKVGLWSVRATLGAVYGSSILTVSHADPVSITVTPTSATVTAGQSISYTSVASDLYANSWDITSLTVFSIPPAAGGSWTGNVYASVTQGTWLVTGTYLGLADSVSLEVSAGGAASVVISPASASIVAGGSQSYVAVAFDAFGNSLGDVTASTVFSCPGGSVVGSVVSVSIAGSYTVTGTYGLLPPGTADLEVTAGGV